MTLPKDRPSDETKFYAIHKSLEFMLLYIIEDLSISLAVLLNTELPELDNNDLRQIYASNEWEELSALTPTPDFDDIYKIYPDRPTEESKMEEWFMNSEFRPITTATQAEMAAQLKEAIENLIYTYNHNLYERETIRSGIIGVYHSQWFCQICGPILDNPKRAKFFKDLYQKAEKKRNQRDDNTPKSIKEVPNVQP